MKNNNKFYILKLIIITITASWISTSCTDDLDRFPTNDITSETIYSTFEGYKSVLAKVYGAYATPINNGPSSNADITSGDAANTDFIRAFFNLQCMTTEEALCSWSDAGIPDLNYMTWSSGNTFIAGLYYRAIYQITMVNEFLRESTDSKLNSRNITGNDAVEISYFRAESRFLRAFQYWVLMDTFGNPPFVDESTPMGKYLPEQISRANLFKYIESELISIQENLKDPRTNEYGRVDKAACWALLARLYLNAKVYTGSEYNTEAITYASKVIEESYTLHPNYEYLFMADNHLNNPEVILSINYDGQNNQNYGGTTYIINSSFVTTRADEPGVNWQEYYGMLGLGGWYGNRTRKELSERFEATDSRKLFVGSKAEIDDVSNFTDGLGARKFRNVTSTGALGSNADNFIADTDFPLFRLAEMYLVYAEAVLRGGQGGSTDRAVEYFNRLRERAYRDTTGNLSAITLQNIIDERSRELYWECFRRTDLIRFGLYTSATNTWQWKGGIKSGIGVSDHLNLFPLPSSDVMANPNLIQNPGY